ncbi:hypothetical protein BKA67DRAFT_674719 [Truncatella angustata]|uniref:Uncharacterized protein n=1 Tax=Truncatella angustata TaxID=152316 RepID=A0A9P9A1S5_9PEZI|nr:uncharacterized protein BKA67DRAFT_674719 [Truncatella angustata]KAH6658638.1 hypothetical protein BKA67DRAFT_674719 [Truncatella angustata]
MDEARHNRQRPRNRQCHVTHDQIREVVEHITKPPLVSMAESQALFHYLVALLQETRFPMSSDAQQVGEAFRALDRFLIDPAAQPWMLRISFWRLAAMIHDLLAIVQQSRYDRKFSERGKSVRSIALGIQKQVVSPMTSTRQLRMRWRLANRWSAFAEGSLIPLVLTIHDQPENIIRDFSYKLDVLRALGQSVKRSYPAKIIDEATELIDLATACAQNKCNSIRLDLLLATFIDARRSTKCLGAEKHQLDEEGDIEMIEAGEWGLVHGSEVD